MTDEQLAAIAESLYLAEAEGWAYFMHMGDVARLESEGRE